MEGSSPSVQTSLLSLSGRSSDLGSFRLMAFPESKKPVAQTLNNHHYSAGHVSGFHRFPDSPTQGGAPESIRRVITLNSRNSNI